MNIKYQHKELVDIEFEELSKIFDSFVRKQRLLCGEEYAQITSAYDDAVYTLMKNSGDSEKFALDVNCSDLTHDIDIPASAKIVVISYVWYAHGKFIVHGSTKEHVHIRFHSKHVTIIESICKEISEGCKVTIHYGGAPIVIRNKELGYTLCDYKVVNDNPDDKEIRTYDNDSISLNGVILIMRKNDFILPSYGKGGWCSIPRTIRNKIHNKYGRMGVHKATIYRVDDNNVKFRVDCGVAYTDLQLDMDAEVKAWCLEYKSKYIKQLSKNTGTTLIEL